MEKDVAIREWCLQMALSAHGGTGSYVSLSKGEDAVIQTAKKFEEYITGVQVSWTKADIPEPRA